MEIVVITGIISFIGMICILTSIICEKEETPIQYKQSKIEHSYSVKIEDEDSDFPITLD
jgi:hypothetical protein